MRARTATLLAPAVLAASLLSVAGAQAAPAAPEAPVRALPAATAPYQLGFDRDSAPNASNRSVIVADASGQNQQIVVGSDQADPTDNYDPAFSADGTQLAYVRESSPGTDNAEWFIVVAQFDGSNPRQLASTRSTSKLDRPSWSPDGSMIAYVQEGDGTSVRIARISDGADLGTLSAQDWYDFGDPAWSPSDPTTIVATAQSQWNPQLVRVTIAILNGTVSTLAVTALDNPVDPVKGAGSTACPAQVAETQRALISYDMYDTSPAFTPDGGRVAFAAFQGRSLCEVNVDGTGGHRVAVAGNMPPPMTNPPSDAIESIGRLAWAPDGTFLAVGLEYNEPVIQDVPASTALSPAAASLYLASEIVALTFALDRLSATGEGYVADAEAPAFDIASGPITLTVTATPTPGYVGGHTIDVTYTLNNQTRVTITGPTLVAALPAQLPLAAAVAPPCTPASCQLGDVGPRSTVSVTFPLTPKQAVSALASGQVSFTDASGKPTLLTGQAPVVVKQPVATYTPTIGPPGIVTVVTGASFPPGAKVRFTWSFGITAPTTVTVRPDGTFVKQMLVLPHDALGPRSLVLHGFTGPAFGDVTPAPQFMVVPGSPEPPRFFGRG